ncbi:MAG: exodeoxyribonuclease III [Defluviitaleaceae bacterium]|nr:exodeoxyribonuclease III [Defluviitaleaceae bacterium]
MKLISWNVNGLRASYKKGFFDFFEACGADIFCVQETKMQRGQSEFVFPGYHEYWNDAIKKGYSGTLTLTRTEPKSVTYGIGVPGHDTEGRVITLEFDDFYMVNVYTPNARHELVRLDYRMEWEDAFRGYLSGLDKRLPVIVCGDLNVAHTEMDIKNAKSNVKNPGFTPEERAKMTELLEAGFIDTFRTLYPDKRDAYTWWSYMGTARERNVGWRIDYFLTSARLRDKITEAFIMPEIYGSDHCPVGLELQT